MNTPVDNKQLRVFRWAETQCRQTQPETDSTEEHQFQKATETKQVLDQLNNLSPTVDPKKKTVIILFKNAI